MRVERDSPARGSRSLARSFVYRAVVLSAVFLIAHLLNLRQYTAVLSGAAPLGDFQRLCGASYIVFYGLFVACVPVLLIAAALAKAMDWLTHLIRERKGQDG